MRTYSFTRRSPGMMDSASLVLAAFKVAGAIGSDLLSDAPMFVCGIAADGSKVDEQWCYSAGDDLVAVHLSFELQRGANIELARDRMTTAADKCRVDYELA